MTNGETMERDNIIAGRILDDMTDGVCAVDLSGRIVTFNPAAARILGISREEALSKSFGEVFLVAEENDDFNQTILDAIYESSTSHNRVVSYTRGGKRSILSVTTTFLKAEDEAGDRIGVIAVFNDITELQALQEAEARLGEELKANHRELQAAYLKTEESNDRLHAALKKVQVIRIAATAFTILLFLGIGLYVWNGRPAGFAHAPSFSAELPQASTAFLVTPQPLSNSISLTGRIHPLRMVNITSPLSGKIEQVMARYGDLVKAGDALAVMDVAETRIKYREAKAAWIKAQTNYRQIEKWATGSEVVRAQRSLTKAKMSLENQKKTLTETERLFKKGIIPATEYESARLQYANQQMDCQGAEEELKAAQEKGSPDNLKVARFELDNAEVRMKQGEQDIAHAVVKTPVPGIVMKALASGSQAKEGRSVEPGASFQQGEIMVAVGDLSGFSVNCKVDEVDVTRIKVGQKALVSGDAFPGERMTGVIRSISPHAEEGDAGSAAPSFGVRVVIDSVSPELRSRILVGMTANLEIIIYEKNDALMVPLSAVITEHGKRYVMRKRGDDQSAAAEKIEVTAGYTTRDAVEIVTGLKPGDTIETSPGALLPAAGGKEARK